MKKLLKSKFVTFLVIFLAAVPIFANDKPVWVSGGLGTGLDYVKMTEAEKHAYAIGAINGMLVGHLLGAPRDKKQWLESYVENMTDEQVVAIFTKYLQDNPG
jgi:isopentenyl diphosphate isomerase/L-lactate dehydrogenase-like FMN-dependent dehydrogenase